MAWIIFFHYLWTEEGTVVHAIVFHRPLDLFTVVSGFATHLAYGNHKRNLGSPIQVSNFELARHAPLSPLTAHSSIHHPPPKHGSFSLV
jgi:hypothetical protein